MIGSSKVLSRLCRRDHMQMPFSSHFPILIASNFALQASEKNGVYVYDEGPALLEVNNHEVQVKFEQSLEEQIFIISWGQRKTEK